MGKKVEVSYNPQLGYLQTIFHHNFDFLTGIKSYTERTDGVCIIVVRYILVLVCMKNIKQKDKVY